MKKENVKRILFLNPAGYIGGAEKSLIDLVTGLPRDRFRPLVVPLGPGPLAWELNRRGIKTREILLPPPLLRLSRGTGKNCLTTIAGLPFRIFPVLIHLLRLIRRESVDLIQTNGLKAHLLGCLLTILSRRPLVWHFRDYPAANGYSRLFRGLGRVFPAGIIANSRAVKERLGNLDKIKVIYNGIDTTLFQPAEKINSLREELGLNQNDMVIGTIGHFAPLKGYDDLIIAMPLILESVPETRLLIVGEAIYPAYRDYQEKLRELIVRLDLFDKVIFAGQRDDLPAVLNTLDIFVLPSWSEGFGRANLEAMAAGKPVISTRVGGIPEVVLDGETGILVEPYDPDAIARAIIKLALDKDLKTRMGREGIERAQLFSLDKMVNRVVDFYDTLIFPQKK
ncbi:MAG: glycosyltransferase [Candidatus Auribacterota bacterium]|nr:glycosyltransferase [Candidatus Auribacterota bacterium]